MIRATTERGMRPKMDATMARHLMFVFKELGNVVGPGGGWRDILQRRLDVDAACECLVCAFKPPREEGE